MVGAKEYAELEKNGEIDFSQAKDMKDLYNMLMKAKTITYSTGPK